jgi:SARP family transcriptional regulator, regulator of embCAB operon
MEYDILGQLRIRGGPGVRAPEARKIETLLAILLARANQPVTTDVLVADIWADRPPARASAAVHVYISQLRKLLRGDGEDGSGPVVTTSRGYSLRVAPGELDADRFTRLADEGRALFRDRGYGPAGEFLRAACDLWRGPVFGGFVDTTIVGAYATLLEESRLECLELLMETELLRGRHREIIGSLSALTKEHPLRETFYEYLMIALSRCNRRAEALEVFGAARRQLGEQLGIEPGRALRELQLTILDGELCDAV